MLSLLIRQIDAKAKKASGYDLSPEPRTLMVPSPVPGPRAPLARTPFRAVLIPTAAITCIRHAPCLLANGVGSGQDRKQPLRQWQCGKVSVGSCKSLANITLRSPSVTSQ